MKKSSKPSLNKKKGIAFNLFMSTDQSLKDIHETVGIKYDTLQRWHKTEKWKEQKAANSITREKIITTQLVHISNLQAAINAREDKFPNASEQDIIMKAAKIIESLSSKTSLPDYFNVLTEFLQALSTEDLDLAKKISDKVRAFLQSKTREYSE